MRLFAWTGALLFVGSLAYFLLSYLAPFGTVATGGSTPAAITWNVTLFTAFALHHSLFARERIRLWITSHVPANLERSCYVWIASLLFIAVCALWQPVAGVAWEAEGLSLWALRVMQAAGLWLTIKSAGVLDIWELAGLRTLAGPNKARPTGDNVTEYKTTGPYGWVRHPIYSGWFLFVCAASPMTTTRLVFAVVSCAYLLIAIPYEERSMRTASGGAYERYMAQVRWKLLPRVY